MKSTFVQALRRFGSQQKRGFAHRVAVCGSGRMGEIRATQIAANPRFELIGIIDQNLAAAQSLAERTKTRAFGSLAELASDGLNGVIVSTPTFTHADLIHHAEQVCGSAAVLVEKPVDETADKIASLFDSSSIKICCSFQRRFDPSYAQAREIVQSGGIGTPISAQLFFADHPCPPVEFLRQGGNIFMDLSAHDVDYIVNVLQDRVVSVYAVGTCSDPVALEGVHDNATMVLNFAGGATAHLFMSRSAVYGYDQRCEVFGNAGHVQVGNPLATTTTLSNVTGLHKSRLVHSFPQRFQQAFCMELESFGDVLDGNENAWPVTRQDCIHVQRVADAARQSAETGLVVKVQVDEEENSDDEAAVAVEENVAGQAY